MASIELTYVNPDQVRIWRPEGASNLRIEIRDDRCILNAKVRRTFPLSDPDTYFSLQDKEGKEVAILRGLSGLDRDSRKVMEEELDRRYFTPRIERILELKQESSMWRFKVETQRGETEFYVRNWRDSAFEIKRGRWQILSVDGQRFEILDLEQLDGRSQGLMDQLL